MRFGIDNNGQIKFAGFFIDGGLRFNQRQPLRQTVALRRHALKLAAQNLDGGKDFGIDLGLPFQRAVGRVEQALRLDFADSTHEARCLRPSKYAEVDLDIKDYEMECNRFSVKKTALNA